jgi:glycosyltransferase involved in cell wall biosynthesis
MPAAGRPLKVLVKSPFSMFSGYGGDGFGLLRALHEWGCDVYPQPVWVDVPIPKDLLPLFGKSLQGPFDLLINHWDPDHLEITREARQVSRVAVAWTMWEFSPPPIGMKKPCKKHLSCAQCGRIPEWHGASEHLDHAYIGKLRSEFARGHADCPDCKQVTSGLIPHARGIYARPSEGRQGLRERLRWFDMVLGYDEVSLTSLAPYIPPKVHAGVLQGGYESRLWRPIERDWHSERFQFLMHGALNHRKQPWLAIEAWHKLKAEKGDAFAPARLALHTSVPGVLFPELNVPFAHAGIKVFVSILDAKAMHDLYASAHCLLAPSRGEGKNLPALEFMSTAGAVAATNYGGHTQWLGGDWAYPLDYTLGATFGDCPWGAHDAKVSIDHLAERIWHIYTHREEARRKAEYASQVIPKMCDWRTVIENLFRRIGDQVDGPGPAVYDQAMSCRRSDDEAGMHPSFAH